MRDYDDYADYNDQNIRLYAPVLQRVIILAAVIIAVPVVMWTITTFVRSYVARPKLPTLEHVASTNMVGRIPAISPPPPISSRAAADQPAPSRTEASAADAPNSAAALPNPAAPVETRPSPATANSPSSAASLQLPALQAPSPAIVASAASTTGDTSTGNAGAAAVPPAPRLGPRSTDSLTSTGAVGSSDRGIPWPNPNTTSPPDFGASRLPPPPAPPSPRIAAAEALSADEPIRGPIPLPRQRPAIFAMAGSAPVPLPRARPGDAPAKAATTSVVDPPYWPGMDNVR
jgi:hypothetical protein